MKRIILLLSVLSGLVLVSCGIGYNVASATYDDATYFRPGVTARVHVLPDAQTAEQLKAETVAWAKEEGTRLETVYTDPDGVVDIDVTPGTTYLIMSQGDESYARKLERLEEEGEEEDFRLTINMNFGYDFYSDYPYSYWRNYTWRSPWNRPWFSSCYRPWYWYDSWYSPWYGNAYFGYNPWYWNSWSYDPWYYDPWYRPWFGYGFYSGWYGNGWYDAGYYFPFSNFYHEYYHENRRIDPGRNLGGTTRPEVRSGGSYKRIDPKINQLTGSRTSRETDVTKETRTTDPQMRSYQRVSGNTDSKAVYREEATQTNSFYRRSSNLSDNNNNVRNQGTATTGSTRSSVTTNPGSSRSFYRSNATPSGTVNSSRSGVTRSSSGSSQSGSSSTSRSYSSGSSSRSSSSGSSIGSRSGGSYSGGSGSSGSSSTRSGGSSGSSGGGYRR
ncbi:MAG: hypothetical protein WC396_04625 [Bacteroidales bacterium]